MQWLFSFAWSESQLKNNKKKLGIVRTPLRLGGVGILGFWVMGHCQNIFGFRRSFYEEVVYFVGGGRFILLLFSDFEILDLKKIKKKNFGCRTLTFKIPIFRFKTDAGLEADIDLTLNLNFLFQGAVSFHPSAGVQNQPNHETGFFFIHLVGLEGPPNPPVSKARAFRVNVNKHGSCQSKSKMIFL